MKTTNEIKNFLALAYDVYTTEGKKGLITKATKSDTPYIEYGSDFKKVKPLTLGNEVTFIEGFSKENIIVILNNKGKAYGFVETTYTEKDKLNNLHEAIRDASADIYLKSLKGTWKAEKKSFDSVISGFKKADKAETFGRVYLKKEEVRHLDNLKVNNLPYMVTDEQGHFAESPLKDNDIPLNKNEVFDAYYSITSFRDKYMVALKKALARLALVLNDDDYFTTYVNTILASLKAYKEKHARVVQYNSLVQKYREGKEGTKEHEALKKASELIG